MNQPLPTAPRSLDPIARSGLLDQAERALLARLKRTDDGEGRLLERLAHIYRAQGRLEEAAGLFQTLVESGRASTAIRELNQILHAERPDQPVDEQTPWPSPFVMKKGFLSPRELASLWDEIDRCRDDFRPVGFMKADERGEAVRDYDPKTRQGFKLHTPLVKTLVVPKVETLLGELIERLRLPPFELDAMETKITLHKEGGHFAAHRDDHPPTRRISFGYYFQRGEKTFTGGDLLLYDQHSPGEEVVTGYTRIVHAHNTAVFFRSDSLHEATPVHLLRTGPDEGRYAIIAHLRAKAEA